MNLTKVQYVRVVAFALIALITFGLYSVIIGPRWSEASEIRGETLFVEETSATARQKIEDLKVIADDLDSYRPAAERVSAFFPATADQQAFFRQIQTAAGNAGLTDLNLTAVTQGAPAFGITDGEGGATAVAPASTDPAAEGAEGADATVAPPAGTIASQTLTVSATIGDFNSVVSFLASLQTMSRSYLISSVTLSNDGEGTTLSVVGQMFMLPAPLHPDDLAEVTESDLPPVPGGLPSTPVDGVPADEAGPSPDDILVDTD